MATQWVCYAMCALAATAGSASGAATAKNFMELTVDDIQTAYASGAMTATELVTFYLGRVDSLNTKGPALRAVLETNRDALALAARADNERREAKKRGKKLGRLHGVPVMLKDILATKDSMQTTAGSMALLGSKVPRDAHAVALLRKAGAIIFGKAALSEWGNFRIMNSNGNGYSGRGGTVLNPYNFTADPSGSSTGSAVAVSANMAAVSLGGETDGSIVMPANVAAVVGLKPTVGLVSRAGAIPISDSQDSIGPITRTVADAAAVLGAIVGADSRDARSVDMWRSFGHRVPSDRNYEKFLGTNLRGYRVGFLSNERMQIPEQLEALKTAKAALQKSGAQVNDVMFSELAAIDENGGDEFNVLLYEFPIALKEYLRTLGNTTIRSLNDLLQYNIDHPDGRDSGLWEMALNTTDAKAYSAARKACLDRSRRGLDRLMAAHQLDAIAALTDAGMCSPAAQAGYPIITVPAGVNPTTGVPYGMSFVGRAFSEPTLLRVAYAYEQATKARVPPKV